MTKASRKLWQWSLVNNKKMKRIPHDRRMQDYDKRRGGVDR